MFRMDENRVIDATLCGGLARYINHSCNPNCVAETVEVDRDLRIIIFANRRISRGEELAYDYKFEVEDDQHKIPCLCGAPNCQQWMNWDGKQSESITTATTTMRLLVYCFFLDALAKIRFIFVSLTNPQQCCIYLVILSYKNRNTVIL